MANLVDTFNVDWRTFVDMAEGYGPSVAARDDNALTSIANLGRERAKFYRASWNETLDMANGAGWKPETPNVDNLLAHIETHLADSMDTSFEWFFDTGGFEVDIARYLSAEPECMIDAMPMTVMKTGRVITLYVPATYPMGASDTQIIGRGVAIMALVEAFTMMQHPVEVVAGICNHTGNKRISYMVTVQEANTPLDMGRIMFAVAHPAFARMLGWSIKDGRQKRDFGTDASYGGPSRDIQPEDYKSTANENVIVLPSIDHDRNDWSNEEFAVKWIKDQLTRIEEGKV